LVVTILCVGAVLVGLVAATVLPFLPFAAALIFAALLGSGIALAHGMAFASASLSALMLLFSTQIGYGLGLLGAALRGYIFQGYQRPHVIKDDSVATPP